ncbi:MAG: hypothetical protein HQM16_15625 [Deltaproteobacteria bacterium]|nr:hypothetical protein [Deltaproteobacteria bacterium]
MKTDSDKKNRVTKEIALATIPLAIAYLFIAFYEAGFCEFYGIPTDLISINITDVILTNRLTLMVAVLAFLWIALYYNVLPSASSPLFRGVVTLILILSLWLGFTFGRYDAKNKKQYLVTKTTPEQVVLKFYDDNVICAPFDRYSKIIQRQFTIHKTGENASLTYHLENTGPLTPQ